MSAPIKSYFLTPSHICTYTHSLSLTLSLSLSLSHTHTHTHTHTPAPSTPPASLTSSNVVPRSLTIQWGMVPCIHQNEDITGYSVLYGVQDNEIKQAVMISGSNNQTTTVNGLEPDTTYLVQVAGVNAQGVGDYHNLTVSTPQSGFDTYTRVRKTYTTHKQAHKVFSVTFIENSYHSSQQLCISTLAA